MTGDDWSDDEDERASQEPLDLATATRRIKSLEAKLRQEQQNLKDYRSFVSEKLNLTGLSEVLQEPSASESTHVGTPLRDDDSHYFQSYGENGESFTYGYLALYSRLYDSRYPCDYDPGQSSHRNICKFHLN